MKRLLNEIRNCSVCEKFLPFGTNPIVAASRSSKIVIIGQAPGKIVHDTSFPWNDRSGDNLRDWLGIDKSTFYDPKKIALMPMGFCYPGPGKSGDLPPRPECAPLWHEKLLSIIRDVKLILLVGQYAQDYYLGDEKRGTLTETVKNFKKYLPEYFPLPHPSPRNNIWKKKNPWFDKEVLPALKRNVKQIAL
jgi:uracil-DNA glycosylase